MKIGGDCLICPRLDDSNVHSSISGSFLGKFRGRNVDLKGDFWGCGGIYWGYSDEAVFFQGARIKGGIFFQETKTDQPNETKQSKVKAVIRGGLNFLAARIEGWADLTGLYCLHPAFCLSKREDNINNILLNFATATIGGNFQLQIEDKNEINFDRFIDLRSLKVSGDLRIIIQNHIEGKEKKDSVLWMNSSEVNGEFSLEGDIGSTVLAENMRVNGLCLITAIFREDLKLIGLNAGSDVEFYPTIHKKADLSGIHVRGSLCLSSDNEGNDDYFKSLELVHKITSDDWRRFADLQSDSNNFLYESLNNSPCGLILKHAVIGKELRIHRLLTDLGDMGTDFINWRDRFREFLRRSLRLSISICEKYLPNTLSNHLVKWAETGLDRLYGISPKRIKVAYFSDELSFCPGFYWARCYVEQKANGHVISGGLIDCLWNPAAEEIMILGGKSVPIHQLNQKKKLKLETEEQRKDYLRFFCECVWGDEGPFHIYEVPHKSDKPEIEELCDKIKITKEEEPEYWVAQARIIYADYVFDAIFHIHKSGLIEMVEDEPIRDGVEVRSQFAGPYRYSSSGKEKTLEAVRPMQLKLFGVDNEKAINATSLAALKKLEKRFSDGNDKFPDPPKINELPENKSRTDKKMFYSYIGEYRRLLDRFWLSSPMQLPVIDLRGAHVETLNDRRGHGWRYPESLKQPNNNPNWINFEIFLRLEGFSFNRLIHILEKKQLKSDKQLNKTKTTSPQFEVSKTFRVIAEAVPSGLDDQTDQYWRSRLDWLYRQYPQGIPDRMTFHQQPFSLVVGAYRARGDISNLNGILKSKISIEFMLFAQRVTPIFLLIFSLFAGIAFIIATNCMTSTVNDNLLPVVLGVGAGALGAFWFCPEQEKFNRMIFLRFLLVFLFIILVITYLVFRDWFTERTVISASVFIAQILFLSIVIWGLLGRLFIYFFQFIYWLCFGYGLSFFRALLTIILCLFVGMWGVNKANDGEILVLNVEYATPLVDGENQPRFVHIIEGTPSLQPVELDQTKSADEMKCGKAIDPFIYAMDVFISLVDLRQELLCNIRSTGPSDKYYAEWSSLFERTTWQKRGEYLLEYAFDTTHPQMWEWLVALYTILGWIVISFTILTIARNIRNYLGDNNQ